MNVNHCYSILIMWKPQFGAEKGSHGNEEGQRQGTDDDDLFSDSFVYCSFRSSFLDLVSFVF